MYRTTIARPLAGHTNSYHTYRFSEALRGIAGAGLAHVELSAAVGWTEHLDLERDLPEKVRTRLREHGLAAVSLSAHSDLATPEGLTHTERAICWAADYGLAIVNTAIGSHASGKEAEIEFLKRIDRLADAAERAGVVITLETHGPLMPTGRQAVPLMQRISRQSVKVNYDTANVMYYGGVSAVDDLPEIAAFVGHVHLKDTAAGKGVWDFPALGAGSVNFGRVLEILDGAGYDGPLSIELEFQGEPWPPLPTVNASMRLSRDYLNRFGVR
jgi:sugar phosphate isomerase/epimerase